MSISNTSDYLKSSIKAKDITDFISSDSVLLKCKFIVGLHLKKTATGSLTWRYRYKDELGKYRTTTLCRGEQPIKFALSELAGVFSQMEKGILPHQDKQNKKNAQKALLSQLDKDKMANTGAYFSDIYTPYKKEYSRDGQSTLNIIKSNFGHLFDKSMNDVKVSDIKTWYDKRINYGLMRTTLVRNYGAFKAMLNHAATPQDDAPPIITKNPLKDYTLPKETLKQKERQSQQDEIEARKRVMFTPQQQKAIKVGLERFKTYVIQQRDRSRKHGKAHLPDISKQTYPHWFLAFTDIARLTGMRMIDIYNLKWENITKHRLTSEQTLTFKPTKTADKNNAPVVNFPVSGELETVFNNYHKQQGKPKDGYIFKSKRTSGRMDRSAHKKHWKMIKELGGLDDDLDFYSFRHNFISQLVSQGSPILVIAKLVGHTDGTMISKNYMRLSPMDSVNAVQALSKGW